MNTEELLEHVAQRLSSHPEIICAFAFGSIVTGYFTDQSDIDIGIITHPNFDHVATYELGEQLSQELKREVDLSLIDNSLSLVLRKEIATNGKLLFTKDLRKSDHFLLLTPQLYIDFCHIRAPLEADYIAKGIR